MFGYSILNCSFSKPPFFANKTCIRNYFKFNLFYEGVVIHLNDFEDEIFVAK